ncbi:MAG: hypothetical protein ACK56F_25345, partial [bacterium]
DLLHPVYGGCRDGLANVCNAVAQRYTWEVPAQLCVCLQGSVVYSRLDPIRYFPNCQWHWCCCGMMEIVLLLLSSNQ